jgi:hypothetical protein
MDVAGGGLAAIWVWNFDGHLSLFVGQGQVTISPQFRYLVSGRTGQVGGGGVCVKCVGLLFISSTVLNMCVVGESCTNSLLVAEPPGPIRLAANGKS